ncbi:hypothetical protein [Aquabacterium sp.]|uniref:hypothetical protein n=1 Tax=Aquabacterium sp. TaxID=1872578 RepID=UPI003B686798
MSKAKPERDPKALPLTRTTTETPEQAKGRSALLPSINAVLTIDAFKGNLMGDDVDMGAMVESLRSTIKEVQDGDLSRLEAMLVSQATALQTMFTSVARRAAHQEQLKHYSVFMGLALKAQAQSRATISALVDLKYPRQATFIKQANVAHGPQQVNNGPAPAGTAPHAKEVQPDQTELLEADHHGGTAMDRRTATATARSNPAVEAVGAVNRPANRRGKGQGITQR